MHVKVPWDNTRRGRTEGAGFPRNKEETKTHWKMQMNMTVSLGVWGTFWKDSCAALLGRTAEVFEVRTNVRLRECLKLAAYAKGVREEEKLRFAGQRTTACSLFFLEAGGGRQKKSLMDKIAHQSTPNNP